MPLFVQPAHTVRLLAPTQLPVSAGKCWSEFLRQRDTHERQRGPLNADDEAGSFRQVADLPPTPDFFTAQPRGQKYMICKAEKAAGAQHPRGFVDPFSLVCPVMKRDTGQNDVDSLVGDREGLG